MNCGFCAEYCPFDAIKMDHNFDVASTSRSVYNLEKLLKPASYYAEIRPLNFTLEEDARKAKEAAKAAKAQAAAAPAA
jgi:NADH-quinone oxidoreductase subunit I